MDPARDPCRGSSSKDDKNEENKVNTDDFELRLKPNVAEPSHEAEALKSWVKKDVKKVLLMGKSGSGKSSMRSIIFSNYVAIDTRRLGVTIDVEHSHVKFLGNLNLNLWDCGGQDAFMETYLSVQRDHVFANAAVLIYVFDAESKEFDRDLITYNSCIRALASNSPDAAVFVLVHKIDLIPEPYRDTHFAQRVKAIEARSETFKITPFQTSIWTQSLYRAWSQIVAYLIPNVGEIEALMGKIMRTLKAREMILFERTTFLPVCIVQSAMAKKHGPENRQDRISHIVKNFRQSINKYTNDPSTSAGFKTLDIKTPKFSTTCMRVSANMYVFMALNPGEATFNCAVMGLEECMGAFEKLDVKNATKQGRWSPLGEGVAGDEDEDDEEDEGDENGAEKGKGKGKAKELNVPDQGGAVDQQGESGAKTGQDKGKGKARADDDGDLAARLGEANLKG